MMDDTNLSSHIDKDVLTPSDMVIRRNDESLLAIHSARYWNQLELGCKFQKQKNNFHLKGFISNQLQRLYERKFSSESVICEHCGNCSSFYWKKFAFTKQEEWLCDVCQKWMNRHQMNQTIEGGNAGIKSHESIQEHCRPSQRKRAPRSVYQRQIKYRPYLVPTAFLAPPFPLAVPVREITRQNYLQDEEDRWE
jgi:hypothetical protein